MESIREHEYKEALSTFTKILETQPNLFGSKQAGDSIGKSLSEATWAFIDDFVQKKHSKVERPR